MAQLPTINVKVVDGELLEILVTLLEDISKIDVEALDEGVGSYDPSEQAYNEVYKLKQVYLYAQAATERFSVIQKELQSKISSIEIHLTQ